VASEPFFEFFVTGAGMSMGKKRNSDQPGPAHCTGTVSRGLNSPDPVRRAIRQPATGPAVRKYARVGSQATEQR
jgi:hypothetical protein